MKKITITIDGVSWSGKGTTASWVAEKLWYVHIDSGATYRVLALYFLQHEVDLEDKIQVLTVMKDIHIKFVCDEVSGKNEIFLNGKNVEQEIRKQYISDYVFFPAQIPEVRKFLIWIQKKLWKKGGVVMDGRDIGKMVFPEAELKIYLTADLDVRAERRYNELLVKWEKISLEEVKKHFEVRDGSDVENTYKCENAVVVDTTDLTIEEQIQKVVDLASKKIKN